MVTGGGFSFYCNSQTVKIGEVSKFMVLSQIIMLVAEFTPLCQVEYKTNYPLLFKKKLSLGFKYATNSVMRDSTQSKVEYKKNV